MPEISVPQRRQFVVVISCPSRNAAAAAAVSGAGADCTGRLVTTVTLPAGRARNPRWARTADTTTTRPGPAERRHRSSDSSRSASPSSHARVPVGVQHAAPAGRTVEAWRARLGWGGPPPPPGPRGGGATPGRAGGGGGGGGPPPPPFDLLCL